MMHNSIERIPIQTLSGVISIHEVLPDLPLPSHLPTLFNNGMSASLQHSLIHHPQTVPIAEKGLQQHGRPNDGESSFEMSMLLENLTYVLANTNSDDLLLYSTEDLVRRDIFPKDGPHDVPFIGDPNINMPNSNHSNNVDTNPASHIVDIDELPPLFSKALRLGASRLEHKSAFQCFVNNLGNTSWPPPPVHYSNSNSANTVFPTTQLELHSDVIDKDVSTSKSHKKKEKKKKKKKKHRHQKSSSVDENEPSAVNSVPPGGDGFVGRLKIRLNPATGPGSQQLFTVENTDHKESKKDKDKKKKKKKDKDKDKDRGSHKKHHKHRKHKEHPSVLDNSMESLPSQPSQIPHSNTTVPIVPLHPQDMLQHESNELITTPLVNTNLFINIPSHPSQLNHEVDPLLQSSYGDSLLPSFSPLSNIPFSSLPPQQVLPPHVPLDYPFQTRPRGIFEDVIKGDHNVLNGDEQAFLSEALQHDTTTHTPLLINGEVDLHLPSFQPPTQNEEETCRAGNLLQVISSGRGGSEYGQGRGKPDSFEAHLRRGAGGADSSSRSSGATKRNSRQQSSHLGDKGAVNHATPGPRRQIKRRRNNELDSLTKWTLNYDKPNEENDEEEAEKEGNWDQRLGSTTKEYFKSVRSRRNKKPDRQEGYPDDDGEECQEIEPANSSAPEEENELPRKRKRLCVTASGDGNDKGGSDASALSAAEDGDDYQDGDDKDKSSYDNKTKKRKKGGDDDDEDFTVRTKEPVEVRYPHLLKNQERSKPRRERVSRTLDSMLLSVGAVDSSGSANMEDISIKRFLHRIHQLFQRLEDAEAGYGVDLRGMLAELQPQLDRCTLALDYALAAKKHHGGVSKRHLDHVETIRLDDRVRIPRSALSELVQEISKLKALSLTSRVSLHKLQTLLLLLHLNILEGSHLQPLLHNGGRTSQHKNSSNDHFEEELSKRQEIEMERVVRSTEASLSALMLMTSPDMPKEVFVEDIIDRSIFLLRNQLMNTIFQEFDPAYRVDESAKDIHTSIRTKRARERDPHLHKSRAMQNLYHRLIELTSCLAQLVAVQPLTDTLILQLSSIGVSIFFVENVPDLQLMALKLLTNVFAQYEGHRQNILDEILASIDRLPSSKRNLRAFRLNSEESIQMFTSLVLMLVQSVVRFPTAVAQDESNPNGKFRGGDKDEVLITQTHTESMRTAYSFLYSFLRKSTQKQEDQDYRNIFENFVNDLLLTVNKPEWPVAEMLLSLLGSLLVKQFNDKNLDQATRVTSVDYLGTVASTLRRDAVSSQLRENDIDNIIKDLRGEGLEESGMDQECEKTPQKRSKNKANRDNIENEEENEDPSVSAQSARIQALTDALIAFLSQDYDVTLEFSRKFYLAQWLSDCGKELETQGHRVTSSKDSEKANGLVSSMVRIEERKQHYLHLIYEEMSTVQNRAQGRSGMRLNRPNAAGKNYRRLLDYEEACLVCRYLASLRPFSQSFDLYISQICKLLNENSVAVRTKAMRCLSAVVEADPSVLARKDIERGVHNRFLDSSTSVREAAIELVGKYCLTQRSLVAQYYPLLAERILDKGISVRKRVIKIFRDICLEHPEFEKNTEICVKMIRRVNDEEGIKKLVNEVFQNMWFTPVRDRDNFKLLQKVVTITDVVASCQETSNEWFLQFLESLLNKEEKEKIRPVEKACKQIVDSLVQHILRLEEISQQNNSRLIACLATLHLFTRAQPTLMVNYAQTLSPYLRVKCTETNDHLILHHASRILEIIIPLMNHPDKAFLDEIEKTLLDLMTKQGKLVLESSVACLSAVLNHCTRNFTLVKNYFVKRYNVLLSYRPIIEKSLDKKPDPTNRSNIMRSVFVVGLLCKYFEFHTLKLNDLQQDDLFKTLMFYTTEVNDADIRRTSLSGLGFLCTRNIQLLCSNRVREFYSAILLAPPCTSITIEANGLPVIHPLLGLLTPLPDVKVQVMENLHSYLSEDERRIMSAESQWSERHQQESLKETDPKCSAASQVAQYYYKPVLNSFLHPISSVRSMALCLIVTILRQGLMNPIHVVASLIALQTDWDSHIRNKTDLQLQEIDYKFPSFINTRACEGVLLSYELQRRLTDAAAASKALSASEGDLSSRNSRGSHHHHSKNASLSSPSVPPQPVVVRGTRDPLADVPTALNEHLYSLLRGNRNMRHSLVSKLLSRFEETQLLTKTARLQSSSGGTLGEAGPYGALYLPRKDPLESEKNRVTLGELLYLCDNLAYFPYQSQEEPLYVIYQSNLIVGLAGENICKTVRDVIFSDLVEQYQQEQQQLMLQSGLDAASAAAAAMRKALFIDEDVMTEAALLDRLGFSTSNSHPTGGLLMNPKGHHLEHNINLVMQRRWVLRECVEASRACFLLLMLKQFFKELYSINDAKIRDYHPNHVKQWDKPLTRRPSVRFKPKHILQVLSEEQRLGATYIHELETKVPIPCSSDQRRHFSGLVREYIEFHNIMLTIDPDDGLHGEPMALDGGVKNSSVPTQVVAPETVPERVTAPPDGGRVGRSYPHKLDPKLAPQAIPQDPISSLEEDSSEDSEAEGSSRLRLAKLAKKRRSTNKRNTILSSAKASSPLRPRKKKPKKFKPILSSSESDSQASSNDSHSSDPDY